MMNYKMGDLYNHEWEKVNLVTISRGKKSYDLYKCKKCHIKAKRPSFSDILEIKESVNLNKVKYCTDMKAVDKELTGRKIQLLTDFSDFNNKSARGFNIGDICVVCDPPEREKNKYPNMKESVWIMGVYEPIRLLSHEFKLLDDEQAKV